MAARERLGGVRKVVQKGRAEPDAVRFHVPREGGGFDPVTWGEVLRQTERLALWLDNEGVGAGTKVAVYATTRVEWGWVVPAIEACRGVFVPVYFSNTAEQTRYVVNHADAEVLFTEKALLPRVLERWADYPQVRRVVVWDGVEEEVVAGLDAADRARLTTLQAAMEAGERLLETRPGRLDAMVEAIELSDVAAIIYTSGTTGVPKGVQLTLANLAATMGAWTEVLEHAFPPEGERRDILWLPVSHMSGWGILGQGTLFDYETWLSDPWRLLEMLPQVRPTMLFSVPAYWKKLYGMAVTAADDAAGQHAELRRLTGGALKFLLSGGAGLEREVKEFFDAAGIRMIEGYGLTECSPNLTMNRLDDFDYDSVGKPVPGVQLKLAEDGEVLAKGDNVFSGYYKDPEATAASFDEEGWFRTGDLGAWTERGFLRLVGRKKEIIVTSAGKNIGPAGIEGRFVGEPLFEHVVLYGNERKYLVALVTLAEASLRAWAGAQGIDEADWGALVARPEVVALVQERVEAVNAQLASYETIKKVHIHPGHLTVDAGHLTPSLKLRRRQVCEDFGPALEALYA